MQSIYHRILIFRLQQLRRTLILIGPVYSLLSLGLLSLLLFSFFTIHPSEAFASRVLVLSLMGCLGLHLMRKDLRFLQLICHKKWLVIAFEYTLLTFPSVLWFMLHGFAGHASISLLMVLVIAGIPAFSTSQKIRERGLWTLLPNHAFEWRTGVRQHQVMLVVLLIAGIALSFLPYVSLFMAWIINAILCSFYRFNESLTMLDRRFLAEKKSFSIFLWHEYLKQVIVLAPIHLSFLAFHPAQWAVVLGCFILLSIVFLFTVISKYAYYRPDQSNGPAGLYYSLAQISPLLPFLLPIPLLMGIFFYPKAIHTIQSYRYASN